MVVMQLKMRDHLDAAIERLAEYAMDVESPLNVWRGGEVPVNASYPYITVWPSLRFDASTRRMSDNSTTQAFRLTTQYSAQSAKSARWLQEQTYNALHEQRLVVDGHECSAMHLEPGAPVAQHQDLDYLYVGADSWTFVSTPQL